MDNLDYNYFDRNHVKTCFLSFIQDFDNQNTPCSNAKILEYEKFKNFDSSNEDFRKLIRIISALLYQNELIEIRLSNNDSEINPLTYHEIVENTIIENNRGYHYIPLLLLQLLYMHMKNVEFKLLLKNVSNSIKIKEFVIDLLKSNIISTIPEVFHIFSILEEKNSYSLQNNDKNLDFVVFKNTEKIFK